MLVSYKQLDLSRSWRILVCPALFAREKDYRLRKRLL